MQWFTGQPDGGQLGALHDSISRESDEEDCVLMAQGHSGGGWDDWDCQSDFRAIPLCQSGQSDTVAQRTSDTEAHALIDNDQLFGRVTFAQAAPSGVDITIQLRYKDDATPPTAG